MLFAGDACFNYHNVNGREEAVYMLSELKAEFEAHDIRVMNLENPLGEKGTGFPIKKSGPNLMANPESIAFFEEAGVDVAILANNHTGDFSDEALLNTFDILDKKGIGYAGAGKNLEEAYKAYRGKANGVSFSVIAVCENEFGIAKDDKPGTAGFSLSLVKHKIEEEKKVSDTVIVSFHGGCEGNPLPSPLAKERYRLLTEFGADAVIAGHTHCAQGYEVYGGKPIIYSMGNFNFMRRQNKSDKTAVWFWGYMVSLEVKKGSCGIKKLIPYKFENDDGKMYLLADDEKAKAEAFIAKTSAIIQDDKLLNKYYDGWCMGSGMGYAQRFTDLNITHFMPENQPANIPAQKNLLFCESHNELVKNTLLILFEGRMDEAIKASEELCMLSDEENAVID